MRVGERGRGYTLGGGGQERKRRMRGNGWRKTGEYKRRRRIGRRLKRKWGRKRGRSGVESGEKEPEVDREEAVPVLGGVR